MVNGRSGMETEIRRIMLAGLKWQAEIEDGKW